MPFHLPGKKPHLKLKNTFQVPRLDAHPGQPNIKPLLVPCDENLQRPAGVPRPRRPLLPLWRGLPLFLSVLFFILSFSFWSGLLLFFTGHFVSFGNFFIGQVCLFGLLFIFIFLPETRGKTPEETAQSFVGLQPLLDRVCSCSPLSSLVILLILHIIQLIVVGLQPLLDRVRSHFPIFLVVGFNKKSLHYDVALFKFSVSPTCLSAAHVMLFKHILLQKWSNIERWTAKRM